jgi:CDP-4-dehydro-6-deoxyglucose reductase
MLDCPGKSTNSLQRMPTVTLNTGQTFAADPTVSILDAARNAGVTLEYSCRTGRCGICKAPLLAGATEILRTEESLSAEEARDGLILTCCRVAMDDVALDIEPLERLAGLEIKTMASRIVSIDRLAQDIVRVVLKTPPTSTMRFLPGQYVDVIAEGGVRRSYSLANALRADGQLELIIKRYKGGILSEYWFERAKVNDLLRIEGPFGTFFLREEGPTNIVFLATGTGIAPVKALLEELAANPERAAQHRLTVFWGNREAESFCWDPVGLGLDVGVHHLLSGPDANWSAARGYVHDAAIRQGIDPDDTVVYACGSNAMITSAREALLALGLPAKRFFSDAFVSSN